MPPPDPAPALVLTGGGTGGHFFPAVALAEGAKARWPDRPILFIGSRRGLEGRKLPESAWSHELLDVEGFVGRSPLKVAGAAWKLWRAKARLLAAWKGARPWAVVGTGGYAAAPALLAARSLGIPYFLHESNAAPGRLVRQVARDAKRVWCGLEAVKALLPGADCLTVGTPVRPEFRRAFRPVEALGAPFRLLVLGGSGGARALNEAMLGAAPGLLDTYADWEILHQAGPAEFERLKAAPRHPRHGLVPFIEDMAGAMEGASLVVSRAGASTCAELEAAGRGALLVPLPGSAGDHQAHNARALAGLGRAVVVVQGPDLGERLPAEAGRLMADAAARVALAGTATPNRAVEACLDDLEARMAGS
ncbi:MAG: UDP-N-acetylglucosamine--N-acetylmuramyl-(pentapeptide) pyrophosphoryl-undecaprenol N-acetylglucosamine transferase [Holophagaceae bacterium]